jgi:predicted MFS family arabinose efflux permease
MLYVLLTLASLAVVLGVIWAVPTASRSLNERDHTPESAEIRHPVLSNPILIWLALFPVIVLIGSVLWMTYYR